MPSAPAARRRTAAARLLAVAIVAALAVGVAALLAQAPWSAAALPTGTAPQSGAAGPVGLPGVRPSAPPVSSGNAPPTSGAATDGRATRLSTFWGVDVSWPQCDGGIPSLQAGFAVVGVNGGRPFTDNPCLAEQVAYGKQRSGYAAYLNLDAPRGEDARGYGRRAALDGLARAHRAGLRPTTIWLDVEVLNHWTTSGATNVAVINAAIRTLQQHGVIAGVYSSVPMWQQITGGAQLSVPVWLATAVTDYRQLPQYCDSGLGGRAADMAQYVAWDGHQLVDVDVLCAHAIPAVVSEFAAGRG